MGIIQVLDTAFQGDGLKAPSIASVDKIESSGSLLLLDMSKVNALPASGGTFPNLFASRAKQITGEDSIISYSSSITDVATSKIERTPKGGLHFIAKPAVIANLANFANIKETGGVKKFIKNKRQNVADDHDFFFSMWFHYTSAGASTRYNANYSNESNHNLNKVFMHSAASNTGTGAKRFSYNAVYGKDGNGTVNLPTDTTNFNLFNGGFAGLNKLSAASRQYESVIFYRFYVEDLTVSGRTFEQVDALDNMLFTEAFAAGGKFFGDTFSDPATAL